MLTISSRVMVSDEATLILCDGVVLTCAQGIDVGDHKLTVFVQSVGDGKLVANAPAQTTAIYGNVAICGGIIEAKGGIGPGNALGGDGIGDAGKQVLIGGGNVTARGGEGQRGGRNQNGGDGGSGLRGTIVIQGLAYVNAYGGNGGHCGISNGTALNGGNGGDGITGDIKGYGAVNAVGGTGDDGSSGRVNGQDGTPGQAISGEHSNVTISPRKRCVQQIP